MNEKEIAELLKYSSPKGLYIMTIDDVLIKLICPFKVVVMVSVGELISGKIAIVEKVKITYQLITVFEINEKLYYYYYFDFVLD
jgi:hypothetical protein